MRPVVLVLICVALSVAGQFCLRLGARDKEIDSARTWATAFLDPSVVLGLVLWTVSTAIWLLVLSRVQLSFAYTLYGLTYVFTPLVAVLFLGEHLGGWRLAGMLTVTAGVMMTLWGRMQEQL